MTRVNTSKEEFLYNYLNEYAPVAQETRGQEVWKQWKLND